MNVFNRMLVLVLISVALFSGLLVTFSYVTGIQKPFEFFSRIQILIDPYLLVGILLMVAIIIFGAFIFFKERLLGYT